eukprot:281001-Prorocentrum_minimum.AAC.2
MRRLGGSVFARHRAQAEHKPSTMYTQTGRLQVVFVYRTRRAEGPCNCVTLTPVLAPPVLSPPAPPGPPSPAQGCDRGDDNTGLQPVLGLLGERHSRVRLRRVLRPY